MPVIQCDIGEGRSPEQKQATAQAVTRAVHETIGAPIGVRGVPASSIDVLIRETPGAHHVKAGLALPDYVPG